MKTIVNTTILIALALSLGSCAAMKGFTLTVSPDGTIGGSYTPPPQPIVIHEK